ncbi:hypothetical protein ABPG74_018572 [Tetrahymena malaccensis]
MNKLLAIIAIISIQVLYVNGNVVGHIVPCANQQGCGDGCGAANINIFQNWAQQIDGCYFQDCSRDYSPNINGWLCKSCNGVSGAHSVYANGQFYQGSACVAACTGGYTADSNQICQPPVLGTAVQCGAANGANPATCTGCGATVATQGLFTGVASTATCSACVASCTGGFTADNNQICQPPPQTGTAVSCGTANGSACVASCTGGFTADNNQICQPPPQPGTAVSCGTANVDPLVLLLVLKVKLLIQITYVKLAVKVHFQLWLQVCYLYTYSSENYVNVNQQDYSQNNQENSTSKIQVFYFLELIQKNEY